MEVLDTFVSQAKQLYKEFLLFRRNPIEYIYLFTYPADKKVVIQPYDPEITKVGEMLVNNIKTLLPEMPAYYIGSSALRIAGQRDIDIYIACPPEHFSSSEKKLIPLLGKLHKKKSKFVQWLYRKNSCMVDVLLVDPRSSMFKKAVKTYEVLKADKELLEEYKKLKEQSSHLSMREYQKKKLELFDKTI